MYIRKFGKETTCNSEFYLQLACNILCALYVYGNGKAVGILHDTVLQYMVMLVLKLLECSMTLC